MLNTTQAVARWHRERATRTRLKHNRTRVASRLRALRQRALCLLLRAGHTFSPHGSPQLLRTILRRARSQSTAAQHASDDHAPCVPMVSNGI